LLPQSGFPKRSFVPIAGTGVVILIKGHRRQATGVRLQAK
jgi:hypothetical protein